MSTSKVRDAGATTMSGGGFAADGDLTLGGSFWSLDVVGCRCDPDNPTQLGPCTGGYHGLP